MAGRVMMKKQKRDKAYYEERLIRDNPGIYADLVDGKHAHVTDAAIAAGLKNHGRYCTNLRTLGKTPVCRNEMSSQNGCWLNQT